jgi:hypothetical protein
MVNIVYLVIQQNALHAVLEFYHLITNLVQLIVYKELINIMESVLIVPNIVKLAILQLIALSVSLIHPLICFIITYAI